VDLTAEPVVTFPALEHPDLQAAFMAPGEDLRAFLDHPVNDAAFAGALAGRAAGPRHQVGGYAYPVQGPVEWEVAMAALGSRDLHDPRFAAEQAQWTLLAQVDTDDRAGMMWATAAPCTGWRGMRTCPAVGSRTPPSPGSAHRACRRS